MSSVARSHCQKQRFIGASFYRHSRIVVCTVSNSLPAMLMKVWPQLEKRSFRVFRGSVVSSICSRMQASMCRHSRCVSRWQPTFARSSRHLIGRKLSDCLRSLLRNTRRKCRSLYSGQKRICRKDLLFSVCRPRIVGECARPTYWNV